MLDTYLERLNVAFNDQNLSPNDLVKLGSSPFLEQYELAAAAFFLLSKKNAFKTKPLTFQQLESGAVLLYEDGFFPWGAFPYPKAHAELGYLLASQQEYKHMAEKMAAFQWALLDHHKKPIYSLLQQEGGCFFAPLEIATRKFLESLSLSFPDSYEFVDKELGIISRKDTEKTIVLCASGCKTGMGAFLFKDIGVLNFAPQIRPVGDSSSFGLSAKADHLEMNLDSSKISLAFHNRLAFSHTRKTGLHWLADSGFSGVWFHSRMQTDQKSLSVECEMESFRPLSELAFSFFCRANSCFVAKSHKLNPRSLDRYIGPCQPVELRGHQSLLTLEAHRGFSQMEIIPLAGDEGFWGSDFLISFSFKSPHVEFSLKMDEFIL